MPIKTTRPVKTHVPGIWQDGPSRFLVRVQWTEPSGRRRERTAVVEGSFAAAVAKREALQGAPPVVRATKERFSDLAERWLEVHSARLAPSTAAKYVNNLAHLAEGLGVCYVDALKEDELEAWQAREKGRGWSNQTLNTWLRTLRVVLQAAVKAKVLANNPARAIATLPEGRTKGKRGVVLDVDQFRRVLEAVDVLAGPGWLDPDDRREPDKRKPLKVSADIGRMVKVLAWTGIRRGELIGLRWTDVVDGELTVERSVWRRGEKATKTDDPRRVTVAEPLARILEEQRQWLLKSQHKGLGSGLVFPASLRGARAGASRRGVDEVSWFRGPGVLDKPLDLVSRCAGVPAVSPHAFRRTMERLEKRAGVEPLVRRATLG